MDLSIEKTHGPHGIASTLERHNAVVAKHKKHSMNDFIILLSDHHGDLVMEKVDTDTPTPETQFDFVDLECPKCKKDVENSTDLLDHYQEHLIGPEKFFYESCGVLRADIHESLRDAMKDQTKKSVIKKKIKNRDFTVNCTLDSPLAVYLSMQHMRVFLDEPPTASKTMKQKLVMIELDRPDRQYALYFGFSWIERAANRVRNKQKEKKVAREMNGLENRCDKAAVDDDDLFYKTDRTEEETKCLAQALNLPDGFTQKQLQDAIEEMIVHRPDLPESTLRYDAVEDQEGNLMTNEQRKLISTLSSNFTYAPGTKRRGTRNKTYNFDDI